MCNAGYADRLHYVPCAMPYPDEVPSYPPEFTVDAS